jgi:hypothetical protein
MVRAGRTLTLLLAASLLAAGLLAAGPIQAGWSIEEVLKGDIEGRQQVVIQGNRVKHVELGEGGKPTSAFIMDFDVQTLTQVDYDERSYTAGTIQEFVGAFRHMTQALEKEMAEGLKQMPPEQRQAVEDRLRAQRAEPNCPDPITQVRRSGQQETIAGYTAVRYDVLVDDQPAQFWVARDLPAYRDINPQKAEAWMAAIASIGSGECNVRQGYWTSGALWKLMREGYPVRTVNFLVDTTVEVVKAQQRQIPAAEFQPPAGFKRKTFKEAMGQ